MEIILNGQKAEISQTTLLELVMDQELVLESLIIEYNYAVAPQESWKSIHLKAGDHVELLSFVGGG